MAFVQLSPGAQMLPAPPASVPSAPHSTRVGPQRLIQELSEKESEFCTSDLHGRVFHMGLDSTQCDFSFPLSLIQIGTRFFLVDHSCPDVAIFFFIFLYFSFIFKIFFFFFATKRTHVSSVSPLDRDLTSVDSSALRVLVPARVLYQTLLCT